MTNNDLAWDIFRTLQSKGAILGNASVPLIENVLEGARVTASDTKKYTIHLLYTDGDSNGVQDCESTLEGEWSLETAKENLRRLRQHYNITNRINGYVSCGMAEKEAEAKEALRSARWVCKVGDPIAHRKGSTITSESECDMYLKLVEDDGTEYAHYIFWSTWIAMLMKAEVVVVVKADNDMVFEP